MKTSELTGAALDWAVAKSCRDDTLAIYFDEDTGEPLCHDDWEEGTQMFQPSTDWSQGGPIIEREGMTVGRQIHSTDWSAEAFNGTGIRTAHIGFGPTPLIAAMHCFVASKLGDEVEVPDELR